MRDLVHSPFSAPSQQLQAFYRWHLQQVSRGRGWQQVAMAEFWGARSRCPRSFCNGTPGSSHSKFLRTARRWSPVAGFQGIRSAPRKKNLRIPRTCLGEPHSRSSINESLLLIWSRQKRINELIKRFKYMEPFKCFWLAEPRQRPKRLRTFFADTSGKWSKEKQSFFC